nr:reverse transcriptase domain-containing protein [Tanacetum cinerariifolium]
MEERYVKFIDIIKEVRINVPLVDVLAGMPSYGKFLKDLVSNNSKMGQISVAFLNKECSIIVQNILPSKLVKQVNDVTRLQALVDRKKVVVTESTIREALRLDDAEGVDCLPNKETFAELARIGYEKPSTKLTFYKAFFSSHTPKLYMYLCFLQMIIRKQVGDLSTHTTKYTSPALTQKGDAEGDAYEHVEDVNTGDAAEGDDSAAHGEVLTVAAEQSIPSPTPPTPPPQPP